MPTSPLLWMLCVSSFLGGVARSTLAAENELPGVWREFENGGWFNNAKEHPTASGGKRVAWFDQPSRATYLEFDLPQAMPQAVLFVRYSRGLQGDSNISVAFGAADNNITPEKVPEVGLLRMPRTKNWNTYEWLSLPLGDLGAGRHFLVVRGTESRGAGDLDVAVIAPDDAQSRWMPPNQIKDGKWVGTGEVLDAPRPSSLMTAADIKAAEDRLAARTEEREQLAALKAHISAPENKLAHATTWFGNDVAVGPNVEPRPGHTPHNVADIEVAPDGTLFTNVPWEEDGSNVTEFKDGKWINDAQVGNHGGGRAIAANEKYIYFAGNKHRTGEQGIDRRTRQDIYNKDWNVHVDCGTVTGLAADENRVYAAVSGDNKVKVFDADLKPVSSWDVPAPGKLTLDRQGHVWIWLPRENKIARFTAGGERLGQEIVMDEGAEVGDLAADSQERLLVADAGPSEQVLIYNSIHTQPALAGRFGEPGGVYSGNAGKMGPQRFVRLTGVGTDAKGNIYVCSRPSNNGSTLIQAYQPDGTLLWQKRGLTWLDCPDFHPEDPDLLISGSDKLRLDPQAPDSGNWIAEAFTVHHRKFLDDIRHTTGGAGSTYVRKLSNGQVYQYLVDMNGKSAYAYRFDPKQHGEIAIPAGFVKVDGVWVDRDGNGRRDFAGATNATLEITVRGTYEGEKLKLEIVAADRNGFSQTLRHEMNMQDPGPLVGCGVYAGGERRFQFSRLSVKTGEHQQTHEFGTGAGRSDAAGFSMGKDNWTLNESALQGRGNRKGGRPASYVAQHEVPAMQDRRDFEVAVELTTPRNRLFSDRFGITLLGTRGEGTARGRPGIAAVIDNSGDYPQLQLRAGMSGDVLASANLGTEVTPHSDMVGVGFFVDSQGTIWNATHTKGIGRYPVTGFTEAGAPIYTHDETQMIGMPEPFTELRRVYFYPEHRNLMLLNGFTAEHPNSKHHWKRGGKVIRCYDDWSPGQWKLRWEIVPPYEDVGGGNDGDGNIMSVDVAGDYVFVAREGQSRNLRVNRGHVDVYRLDNGQYVGWMTPSDEAGKIGIIDITQGMKAVKRADGEYWVMLEDGAKARTLVYRWRPS